MIQDIRDPEGRTMGLVATYSSAHEHNGGGGARTDPIAKVGQTIFRRRRQPIGANIETWHWASGLAHVVRRLADRAYV